MKSPAAKSAAIAATGPLLEEILELADDLYVQVRRSCNCALRIGIRLLALHRATGDSDAPGGFRGALAALDGCHIHPSTAYRWMNATAAILCRAHNTDEISDVFIPATTTKAFLDLEAVLKQASDGMSLRRLALGWQAPDSDEARMERLVSSDESGDPAANEMLEKVSRGELTLAQAIRGATGSAATKGKNRSDPIYLDIDSTTGQPCGLMPKCLVTLKNTFEHWEQLDKTARESVRESWKALVAKLPRDLR